MIRVKILGIAVLGILVYSCSPKIAPAPPVTEAPAAVLTPELMEGKTLYENNCAKCHKLFPASRHTKEEWVPVLNRMAPKAKITEAQKTSIYNYITAGL
ncbi:c-type cytochrome [Flavobacterium humi]|uniref:C-type cytochrome n=1 Tax=Flavobacterium humi TaxID=2562683 RepID=A0A4Z0LA99_9FLAO|nr:cytochrome c [Flavobacterium humi]TGD59050.1 c-type cytochrome [Flavobacterium humi]